MSWTKTGNRTNRGSADAIRRAASRGDGRRGAIVLPFPPDTRERLAALYRERDELDAARHASGANSVRGQVWAIGLRRLERGDEVYESFRVLSSAGIEPSAEIEAILEDLPQDWRQICQIDANGVVRTASVKQRTRSGPVR